MKVFISLILLFSITTLVGCAGAKGGVAPGGAPVSETIPAITTSGWEYEINQSEKIISSNNWEGTLDTLDVSEQLVTVNGWTVEVSND